MFSIKVGGHWFPVTRLTPDGSIYRADFGSSGTVAYYGIHAGHGALVLRLVKLDGNRPDEVQLAHVEAPGLDVRGPTLAVLSNLERALALIPLDDCVNARLESRDGISASVFPEYGMTGHAVVIASAPRRHFLSLVRDIELAYGLPSPKIDGVWAKASPDAQAGYLFTDLTEANVEETIRYAKLANLKYILTYARTWAASLGSYPINLRSYPDGESGLKATIAKVHAAGLKVGMHMLTSLVSKNDPLVRPVPDPRLLKDADAQLAGDIDPTTTNLSADGPLTGFPHSREYYGSAKAGLDIQIDDEIMHCAEVGVVDSSTFSQCKRGFAGTHAAPHRAGAPIHHLAERFGSYLVDLRTSLKDQVASRIAGLINRDGFDMIYFDGGELDAADGPAWHWVGQEQLAIWQRVHRSLFISGSGISQFSWHLFARANAGDYVAIGKRLYFDKVTLKRCILWNDNFILSNLGWWGLLDHTPSHPATTPQDAEFLAVRMLALDLPIAVQTRMSQLKANRRSPEILRILGRYDKLRRTGLVPAALRTMLRSGEWHMIVDGDTVKFYPVHTSHFRMAAHGSALVRDDASAQPLRFRLRCVPRIARPRSPANMPLFRSARPLAIKPPRPGAPMPGASASTFLLRTTSAGAQAGRHRPGLDLHSHRSLAVTLSVTGAPDSPSSRPAVLDFQLESTGKRYRDYPIDLDFRGQRTIEIVAPQPTRFIRELRPSGKAYPLKASLYTYDYKSVVALNVRWMRAPTVPITVKLSAVSALAETPNIAHRVTLVVARTRLVMPPDLHSEDYVEFLGGDSLRVLDENGRVLSTVPVPKPILLKPGVNRIRIDAPAGDRFELTSFVFGAPEAITVPKGTLSTH